MQFSFYRSLAHVLGAITFFAMTVSPVPVQAGTEDDIHIGASAEFFALYKYPRFKSHKAMAVGPAGYWGHSYGWHSASAAAKGALSACKAGLRRSNLKNLQGQNCVLFDVDGKRTGKAGSIGIPFGVVAMGEDLPWRFGNEWNATAVKRRGTMLLVHGCNGYSLNAWQMAWVNYYRAAGFRVIMPNSFAELRDPDSCPPMPENSIDRQTRNLKLRLAQTARTIAGIRKKFPKDPLYLHGYSEGGYVVQALGEEVDGIIVTGAMCGFCYAGVYQAAKRVPLLLIAGTKDFTFPEAKKR